MVMKKTLRLATAVLLAGVTLGAARTAHGASPHQTRSTAAGVFVKVKVGHSIR